MLPRIALVVIVVIIFGLIFFDIGFLASKYLKPNVPFLNTNSSTYNSSSGVSGTIHLNGPVPQGASISIGAREHGDNGEYVVFAGMAAADDTAWEFKEATAGKSYDFQAYLIVNDQRAFSSDSLSVSAPATDEVLTINTESADASPTPATISGIVYINGYIPDGAVFDLLGRKYGSTGNYTIVADNLSAQIKRVITYSNAISGQKYEVMGQLIDQSGNIIGTSNPLIISAPSDNAEMTVNSTAQPPAGSLTPIGSNTPVASGSPASSALPVGSSTISGTINFNGSAPGGSSIVILAKTTDQTNYNVVVNGVTPSNGATWSWGGATPGTTYNMVAVLKGQVNNQNIDYADSQMYTVAAPAQNQLFTLNTGISMGAPTGSVWVTCGTKGSNNVWTGNTLNFSPVTGAQYYTFQVGSTSGGSDIANISQAAQPLPSPTSNPSQTIPVNNLSDSVIYYAQYAVSSVTNPTPAQMSPFSGAYTFKCPN